MDISRRNALIEKNYKDLKWIINYTIYAKRQTSYLERFGLFNQERENYEQELWLKIIEVIDKLPNDYSKIDMEWLFCRLSISCRNKLKFIERKLNRQIKFLYLVDREFMEIVCSNPNFVANRPELDIIENLISENYLLELKEKAGLTKREKEVYEAMLGVLGIESFREFFSPQDKNFKTTDLQTIAKSLNINYKSNSHFFHLVKRVRQKIRPFLLFDNHEEVGS